METLNISKKNDLLKLSFKIHDVFIFIVLTRQNESKIRLSKVGAGIHTFFLIDIHIMYMNSHTFLVKDYEQTHVHIQR